MHKGVLDFFLCEGTCVALFDIFVFEPSIVAIKLGFLINQCRVASFKKINNNLVYNYVAKK
jgi:hypothetical protein